MFAAGRACSPTRSWAACVPTWPTRSRSSARATTCLWVVNFPLFHWDEDRRPMQPSISLSPCRPRPTSPRSRQIRWQPALAPTTLSWTALRPAAVVCVSTTPRCRCPCSSSWALPMSAPSRSSASSWRRSSLVRPRWAVLLWPGPRVHAAHRFRLHPRRHGVPQDGQRLRPHVGRPECR